MATFNAPHPDSTITVHAYGEPAEGIWPHLRLLVDGVEVATRKVDATTSTAYSFSLPLESGISHKVQVQYFNDLATAREDRNLYVQGVEVNGRLINSTDDGVSFDRGALDGRHVMPGREGLWWNGTLQFDTHPDDFPATGTPDPQAGPSTVVINAQGTPAAGEFARFTLLLDGVEVGEGVVGSEARDFTFEIPATAGAGHKLAIRYDNDAVIGREDRNLTVNEITINGQTIKPTDSIVSYDRGALDGQDVLTGRSGMWWDGALVVDADASYFTSGGTIPPTNPEEPGTPVDPVEPETPPEPEQPVEPEQPTEPEQPIEPEQPVEPEQPPVTEPPTEPEVPVPPVEPPTGPAIYVSTNGNDRWSGQLAEPNADGTDGPKATLTAARDAMRQTGIDTTWVRGGDHFMNEMLWLETRDSGVSFKAYPGETPVIHGGDLISGWTQVGNGLWAASVDGAVSDLTINGERMTLARTGVDADPTDFTDGWSYAAPSRAGLDTTRQFTFNEGDVPQLSSTSGLMVSIFTRNGYNNVTVPVAGIDHATNTITLADSAWDTLGEGSRYYLFNSRDLLDQEGEWFYDASSNQVLLRSATSPEGQMVVGAQQNVMIGLGGAQNVTISGLTLTDGAATGHGVFADRASGLTFTDNTVTNTGYGITVQASTNAVVRGNHFADTGLESIFLKQNSNNSVVSDNLIERAGSYDHGGDALWVNGSSDVLISHNRIVDTPGKAIAVGSVQTDGSDASYRVTITHNQVVNANLETSDGGGIYLINRQQTDTGHLVSFNDVSGTTALGNVTWDGKLASGWWDAEQLVSWGIYLDDWTSGTTVTSNLVHGNSGGVYVHGGWNNVISNNVIADNSGYQIGLLDMVGWGGSKGIPMANNLITGNMLDLAVDGEGVHISGAGNLGTFQGNFWHDIIDGRHLFNVWPQQMAGGGTGSFADWLAAGFDRGSVRVDPGFTAPDQNDYSLRPDSDLLALGFAPLPLDQMGLI